MVVGGGEGGGLAVICCCACCVWCGGGGVVVRLSVRAALGGAACLHRSSYHETERWLFSRVSFPIFSVRAVSFLSGFCHRQDGERGVH